MKIRDVIKLADFFTLANLIFGLFAIFAAINRGFFAASIFLLLSVLFDFLDGKVARMNKYVSVQGKAFGKELDSLADIVSFGVVPAVFGYMLGLQQWYAIIILLFFVSAGALRLSRFNITENMGYYEGMPITMNGIIFPLLYFLSLVFPYSLVYMLGMYAVMGFAMLSTVKIKKLI